MTNADKFKSLFDLYATELWAMSEKEFLEWLNSEVMNCSEIPNNWIPCTKKYPTPWELVWTTDKCGNVEVCQLSHKDSDWYDADEKWFYNHDSIVAWMPYEIPDPYQPKEGESPSCNDDYCEIIFEEDES